MDQAELMVYRAPASFHKNSSDSYASSEMEASKLREAIENFVVIFNYQEQQSMNNLANLIAEIVNETLHRDQKSMYPQITKRARHTIYATIKVLQDINVNLWNRIHSSLFNQQDDQIFIFPGQPYKKEWQFSFGKFSTPGYIEYKHCFPLEHVQHAVHNIDSVLSILRTSPGKAHFKGSPQSDFSGPPLCWFAPLPPAWTDESKKPCDSLDPTGSRYGCYRFTIPFKVLIQRFPTCFVLGTRVYNQENSHTILLTKKYVGYIMLIEKRLPIKLTDTIFIRTSQQPSQKSNTEEPLEWLCFHDDPWRKWDQLEFAIATEELQFDPNVDNIRLDFVDHAPKLCVPSLKACKSCECRWNREQAMVEFLFKLSDKNIKLDTLRTFFEPDVWRELVALKKLWRFTI